MIAHDISRLVWAIFFGPRDHRYWSLLVTLQVYPSIGTPFWPLPKLQILGFLWNSMPILRALWLQGPWMSLHSHPQQSMTYIGVLCVGLFLLCCVVSEWLNSKWNWFECHSLWGLLFQDTKIQLNSTEEFYWRMTRDSRSWGKRAAAFAVAITDLWVVILSSWSDFHVSPYGNLIL